MNRDAATAKRFADRVVASYGEDRAKAVRYVEAFEVCEYGSQPGREELIKLIPIHSDQEVTVAWCERLTHPTVLRRAGKGKGLAQH